VTQIEATADRLAAALAARHVGCGTIECGHVAAPPTGRAAYGDVVANVFLDEDDGLAKVTVSILWRDDEGDLLDVVDVADDLDAEDADSVSGAAFRATEWGGA